MDDVNNLTEQEKLVFALDKLSSKINDEERKEELNIIKQKILVKMEQEQNNEENKG